MGFKRKEGARGAQGCILIHSTEMTQNVYKRGALAPNLVPEPFFLHPLTMLTIEDLKNAFGMQIDVTEFEKKRRHVLFGLRSPTFYCFPSKCPFSAAVWSRL